MRVAHRSDFAPSYRDNSNGIRLARTVPVDADGDGFFMYEDCDDGDASIYPFASDTYGDGIDSDCDGLDCELIPWNGTDYLYCPHELNYSDARATCVSKGMNALAINSTLERDATFSQADSLGMFALPENPAEIWLGLDDIATNGVYLWADGSAPSFFDWNVGQPDGLSSQACNVIVDYSSPPGRWHDSYCGRLNPFVCEDYP